MLLLKVTTSRGKIQSLKLFAKVIRAAAKVYFCEKILGVSCTLQG